MKKSVRILSVLVCLLFFSLGCSTLFHSKFSLEDHLSAQAVQIKLPLIYQQNEKSCGLAAVDMLTWYYGLHLNEQQCREVLEEAKAEDGITGRILKKVLETAGYRVAVFSGTLDEELTGLYRHLKEKRPLIVMVGALDVEVGHYCLMIGYDPGNKVVILADPKIGKFAIKEKEFLKAWEEKKRFTLLAEPQFDYFKKTTH